MPFLDLQTQADLPEKSRLDTLLSELAQSVAEQLGKSPAYVMTGITRADAMRFAGSAKPCCYVSLRGIGEFPEGRMNALSQEICRNIRQYLGISAERVFIVFDEVPRTHWAVRAETLA